MSKTAGQSDLVYNDLIYIQVSGTYLRLKGRYTISHKPLALKPVGKATHYETMSVAEWPPLSVAPSPALTLPSQSLQRVPQSSFQIHL